MRFFRRKRESESTADSTALVVIELPEDELLAEELQAEPRRMARLLAQPRRLARRFSPAGPAKIALGSAGGAAQSVVVRLHPRKLAGAVRAFQRIGTADLARLSDGVGRGAKGVGGWLSYIASRKARSVRAVATALQGSVRDIDPKDASRLARETIQWARKTIAQLDPPQVEEAVRDFVATIDADGKGKSGKPGRGTSLDRKIRAAVARIGPERAVRMAAPATRALKRLLDGVDPDHVGREVGKLVENARSANDRTGRRGAVGFLARLVREIVEALKRVAADVDVVVVVLIVLIASPEVLGAAGVGVAALKVLERLRPVLLQVLSHIVRG